MIQPHGGRLVDTVATGERAERLRDQVSDSPSITLTASEVQDVLNIATGRYSPLTGFLDKNDFLKVTRDKTLEDGTIWPLPIFLDVDATTAETLTPGRTAALRDREGKTIAKIDITDVSKYDKGRAAEEVFGTAERDHPGVAGYLEREDYLIGGDVTLFGRQYYNDFDLSPVETRVLFNERGWDRVVGFQTRNAPHRAHEYIQKSALELVDGLFVQPKLGQKKGGDYRDSAILGAYQRLIDEYYPEERVTLSVFPSMMRYAGPAEAVLDAIVRKNHGCTHFIVGRDHAGVGDYYSEDAAHEIFSQIGGIGIEPLFFSHSFYCELCDGMVSERVCPHDENDRVYPSGSRIRDLVSNGEKPSKKMVRPEVAEYLMHTEDIFITDETDTSTGE